MAHLADAGNTWDHALECLAKDGWNFWSEAHTEDGIPSEKNLWLAKRDENGETIELAADDPLALLALSVVWNKWGHNWREADIPEHWTDCPHFECTYNSETNEETRRHVD